MCNIRKPAERQKYIYQIYMISASDMSVSASHSVFSCLLLGKISSHFLFFVDWRSTKLCYRELLGHLGGAVRPASWVENKLPTRPAGIGRSLRGSLLRDAKFHGLPQQVSLSAALCMQSKPVVCYMDRTQRIREFAGSRAYYSASGDEITEFLCLWVRWRCPTLWYEQQSVNYGESENETWKALFRSMVCGVLPQ